MRSNKLIWLILSMSLIFSFGCSDFRARRSLFQATELAMKRILLLQNIIRSKKDFDLVLLNQIFHRNALENLLPIEEKMRSFYKTDLSLKISLLGELFKIVCPEIASADLGQDCYFIRKVTPERDFEYIEGIIIFKEKDFNQKNIFIKTGVIDGKIEIEKSYYDTTPLLEYLSILPSGKISNPRYEKLLLDKIKQFENSQITY